jgi:uncharacterized phage protein (predicted DNA packaging)
MKILELEGILRHCRLEESEEHTYIESLGQAAEEVVEKYLNRSFEDIASAEGSVPQSIIHACYLIVAELYKNREASSQVQVYGNPALMSLLRPHKRLI